MTTLPTRVGHAMQTAGGVGSIAVSLGTIADGSWMIAVHTWTDGVPSTSTPPSGWSTLIAKTTMGSRAFTVYGKVAASEATTQTWTLSVAGSTRVSVMWGAGADVLANWQIGTVGLRAVTGTSTTNVAPSITTVEANELVLSLSAEATSVAEAGITSMTGATAWFFDAQGTGANPPAIETFSAGYIDKVTPGATGTVTITYPNVQASNGAALLVGLPPVPDTGFIGTATLAGSGALTTSTTLATQTTATLSGSGTLTASTGTNYVASPALSGAGSLTAVQGAITASSNPSLTGTGSLTTSVRIGASGIAALSGSGILSPQSPVDAWIANTPMYVAHRGGSVNWPEHTMFAYDQAAAWRADLAFEVSVYKSADGYWVCNHDNDTSVGGHWSGASGNITGRNWIGDLQNLTSTVGGYPMILLTALLTKYGNSRILFIDNKLQTDLTGFFNLLDTYAGNTRYVIKGWGGGDFSKTTEAAARGYRSWGYFYSTDEPSLATNATRWTLLGMDYAAGSSPWATVNTQGKPVLAHILPSAASKVTADTYGPEGYMVSGVQQVVPQTPATPSLSGSGTLSAVRTVQFSAPAVLGGAGTLAATRSVQFAVAAALSGSGTLAASRTIQVPGIATLGGSGTLGTAVVPGFVINPALSGTGSLGVSVAPRFVVSVALSGSGTLIAGSGITAAPQFTGSGALSAILTPRIASVVSLTGSGSLTASGAAMAAGVASLTGSGSLSAITVARVIVLASLSGAGSLTTFAGTPPFNPGSYSYTALKVREYHGFIPPEE